jgi:hypothetical protein
MMSGNGQQIDFLTTEASTCVPLDHIEARTLRTSRTQAGWRPKGGDLLQLKVVSIKLGNTSHRVVTRFSETTSGEGKQTARKVVGGAGFGAIIGGIGGRGKGAGMGPLVGVAGGTLIAATDQPYLKVPSETRLEFQLIRNWQILRTSSDTADQIRKRMTNGLD